MHIVVPEHNIVVLAEIDDILEYLDGIIQGRYENQENIANPVAKRKEIESLRYGYIYHTALGLTKMMRGQSILIKDGDRTVGTGTYVTPNWNIKDGVVYHQVMTAFQGYDRKKHIVIPATR